MPKRTSLTAAALILAASLAASTHAQVRYVNAARPADGAGASWADAFKSLQSALTAPGTYTEVWVAAGTYTPAATDRNATFTLRNNVSILGGFSGAETASAQRNLTANITILSGDLLGNDQPGASTLSDNSFRVVTGSNTNATAVLDGFTVRAGYSGQPIPFNSGTPGTGFTCIGGSPFISRCIFIDNIAGPGGGSSGCSGGTGSGNPGPNGGAVYLSASTPTFRQCSFLRNSAGSGSSGIYCTFTGPGGGGGSGGAVYSNTSSPTFVNCFFAGNSAGSGGSGGGSNSGNGSSGGSGGSGGAIAFDGAGAYSLTLINCAFSGNRAGAGGSGGNGIFGNGGAGGNAGSGGAIAATSASASSIRIVNCTFSQCLAGPPGPGGGPGGGIGNVGASGAIGRGGAVSNGASAISITNSILWGNTDGTGSGAGSQAFSSPGLLAVAYSDIQGGVAGTGNINTDPLFASPVGSDSLAGTADDDLSLQSASPCIDAANNTALLAPPTSTTDLAGKPRNVDVPTVPDTGVGPAPIADMGAYERQFCSADFNNSGGITVQDIFDFLSTWFAQDPRADFNGVDGITIQDIFDFLAAWFTGC